ncbi:MAG: dCTP deaminase [bacterium]
MILSDKSLTELIINGDLYISTINEGENFQETINKNVKVIQLEDIKKAKQCFKEVIEKFGQIEPASIDLRIGSSFQVIDEEKYFKNKWQSIKQKYFPQWLNILFPIRYKPINFNENTHYLNIETDEFVIPPRTFALATTQEYIKLPNNLTAFVEGRSSIGRLGLQTENAGWVDPGFEGEITLELYNPLKIPIAVTAGHRVCQLVFAFTDEVPINPYNGKYNKQRGATGSRKSLDSDVCPKNI